MGQYYSDICFDEESNVVSIYILSCSSVVASWISTLKATVSNESNLLKTFFKNKKKLFTTLKAPGSNQQNI